MRYLTRRLEYHLLGNHLLANAKALNDPANRQYGLALRGFAYVSAIGSAEYLLRKVAMKAPRTAKGAKCAVALSSSRAPSRTMVRRRRRVADLRKLTGRNGS